VQNLSVAELTVPLTFPGPAPTAAVLTSPVEENGTALPVSEGALAVTVPGRAIQSIRVRFSNRGAKR
jgi:hypothetical protein